MFISQISSSLKTTCLTINNHFGIHGLLLTKIIKINLAPDREVNSSVKNVEDTASIEKVTPDKLYKKVEIEVRGNDPKVLQSYSTFSVTAAAHLGIPLGQCTVPRKAIHERLTLLKAVHVQKKHRVQYETRTYFRTLEFLRLTGSTADTFLEYVQRNLPEGVAMKVTKVEIQKLPESITPPVAP